MARYSIKCPHCHANLKVEARLLGKQTRCPVCGRPFVLPPMAAPPTGEVADPPNILADTATSASLDRTSGARRGKLGVSDYWARGIFLALFLFMVLAAGADAQRWFFSICPLLALDFLPSIVACLRRHPQRVPLLILNLVVSPFLFRSINWIKMEVDAGGMLPSLNGIEIVLWVALLAWAFWTKENRA